MLLHDDVVYEILQWLPVISLLRFKLVCRSWRAFIESSDFIKQHLHHHHHDPILKDKNHSLIHLVEVEAKDSPFTFPLLSTDSFEEPNAFVQLDCSDLREYFPLTIDGIVSYNGIVCLNLLNCKEKHSICLWNPATKQSRFLAQSPALTLETENSRLLTVLGFGFDVKNNDYKLVNLCQNRHLNEERVEVYSLNTDSWRSVSTVFPFRGRLKNPRVPFNNGTCFFWYALNSGSAMILCFDFGSEKFRPISFPDVNYRLSKHNASFILISDKIACVFNTEDFQTEIWVFDEYGSVNESWVKLYKIDPYSTMDRRMLVKWLSMNGNYLLFTAMGELCRSEMVGRYNVVTKELKNLSTLEICKEPSMDWLRLCFWTGVLVEFKESLLSVGKGNNEWIERNDNQLNL